MIAFLQKLRRRFPKGAPVLAAISLVNLVLAFSREATVAYFFGTSSELDTFLVALALPSLLVTNLATITVAVVLPIYVGYREAGHVDRASSLIHKWFWFSGLVVAILCIAIFLSSDVLMRVMAKGFEAEQRAQAAYWLRTLLPYLWMLGMLGVFTVVLNSHDRFAVPALSSPFVSLCVIASCVVGARAWGAGILAVGFGVGAFLAFVWQWLNARRFEPRLPARSGLLADVTLPIAAGGAMVLHSIAKQVDVVVDRAFASSLEAGSVAAYNYARMLNAIPSAVVSSVLATALFPVLARMAAAGDWREALRTVQRWSTALFLVGLVPVTLLIVFRERVVSLVFERGAFDDHGVRMTASVLSVLPFMMITSAVSGLFTQLLLAQRRARVVAILAVATIGAKIVLNFLLIRRYGLVGLALATLIASTAATIARLVIARRYQPTGLP